MKKYLLPIFFLIIPALSHAATYDGLYPKDLANSVGNITTPAEGNPVSEFNNSDREIKLIIVSDHRITPVTGTYTANGTESVFLGSSTSAFTLYLGSATTCGTTTIGRWQYFKNIGAGTMTISGTVTNHLDQLTTTNNLSQGQVMYLMADKDRWHKMNIDTFTTLVVTDGTATNFNATNLTSTNATTTNFLATNGTITNFFSTTGKMAGNLTVSGVTGLVDGDVPDTITLTNITQIGTRQLADMQATLGLGTQTGGTLGLATQTSGLLSLGTQSTGAIQLGTQATGILDAGTRLSPISLGTQTVGSLTSSIYLSPISLGTQTVGSLTSSTALSPISLATQTVGILNAGSQLSKISLGTQTNDLLSLGTQSAGNYVSQWLCDGMTGFGQINFSTSADLSKAASFDSANKIGSITFGLAGSASSRANVKWGTQTVVLNPTDMQFGTQSFNVTASGTTEAVVTLKNVDLGTQTNSQLSLGTQTNGLLSLGTQSTGKIDIGTQTTGLLSLGTQTNQTVGTLSVTGTLTATNLQLENLYGTISSYNYTYRTTTFTCAPGTWTWIPFNADGVNYNSTHTANSGSITVSVPGTYYISGKVQSRLRGNGQSVGLRLMKNDNTEVNGGVSHSYLNAGDPNTGWLIPVDGVVYLNANEWIGLQVSHNNLSAVDIISLSYLSTQPKPSGSNTASLFLRKIGN